MIIETCPECGHDLIDLVLTTYPPIPKKQCTFCDWSWTGKREEIIRVPFNSDIFDLDAAERLKTNINDITDITLFGVDLSNANSTGGTLGTFNQSACANCPNNPKNGGSGVCLCTLGSAQITY